MAAERGWLLRRGVQTKLIAAEKRQPTLNWHLVKVTLGLKCKRSFVVLVNLTSEAEEDQLCSKIYCNMEAPNSAAAFPSPHLVPGVLF
jgi:hypothetical protein